MEWCLLGKKTGARENKVRGRVRKGGGGGGGEGGGGGGRGPEGGRPSSVKMSLCREKTTVSNPTCK